MILTENMDSFPEGSDDVWIEGLEEWQEFVTDTISGEASGEVASVNSCRDSFRLDKSFNFRAIESEERPGKFGMGSFKR